MRFLLIILSLVLFSGNSFGQNQSRNNFFKDLDSIDVIFNISGASDFCGISESQLKSSVAFVLSNTPFKKIDPNSLDTLMFNLIVMNVKNKGSDQSLGCAVSSEVSLFRFADFKGKRNMVSVWGNTYLDAAQKFEISRSVSESIELLTKQFISRWSEQR